MYVNFLKNHLRGWQMLVWNADQYISMTKESKCVTNV